ALASGGRGAGRGARERPCLDAGRSGFSDRLADLFRAGVGPGVARPARGPLATPGSGGRAAAVSPGPPRDGAPGGAYGRGEDPGGGRPARRHSSPVEAGRRGGTPSGGERRGPRTRGGPGRGTGHHGTVRV